MEITYNTDYKLLEVRPTQALKKEDFQDLSQELKSIRKDSRELRGLLVYTREFPGYEQLSDVLAHEEFVREHQQQIPKVAICTDSSVANFLEFLGNLFSSAEVQKFDFDEKDQAEKWLLA